MDDLDSAAGVANSGLKAQATRLRVIAENLANADSVAEKPGGDPYRRKTIQFKNVLDKELGAEVVRAAKIANDQSKLPSKYDPTHPAANKQGYVTTPNVNSLVEMMDMREAQRSYQANLQMIQVVDSMEEKLTDLLK